MLDPVVVKSSDEHKLVVANIRMLGRIKVDFLLA
jgi:hypothetical protein